VKECKLYDKLLDKISSETESLISGSSDKDRPAPVPIPHISIPLTQNNPPTHSHSSLLSYKFLSLSSLLSKKPIVKIENIDNINSDIEM